MSYDDLDGCPRFFGGFVSKRFSLFNVNWILFSYPPSAPILCVCVC